jgi:hypothetical protein
MSVMYARDQRVRQESAGVYRLPNEDGEPGEWTILRENNLWNAYDQRGVYCRSASGKATPEEAIAVVIGEPESRR